MEPDLDQDARKAPAPGGLSRSTQVVVSATSPAASECACERLATHPSGPCKFNRAKPGLARVALFVLVEGNCVLPFVKTSANGRIGGTKTDRFGTGLAFHQHRRVICVTALPLIDSIRINARRTIDTVLEIEFCAK
jgi:hypothetical protein